MGEAENFKHLSRNIPGKWIELEASTLAVLEHCVSSSAQPTGLSKDPLTQFLITAF